MQCPDCGGPMWDNRGNKRNPKQPDFKCKDKDGCGKGVWEQRSEGRAGAGRGAGNGNGNGAGNVRSTRPLGPLYFSCMKVAAATVKQHIGDKATPSDVIAATATLFIGATNTGAPLLTPKPKPAPKPEPEPEYEEAGEDYADDAALPF